MNLIKSNDKSVPFGVAITLALIGFFFSMQPLGLVHNLMLRALNGIFMFAGVFLAVRQHRKNTPAESFRSLNGLSVGLRTAMFAAIAFATFVSLYLLMDEAFMAQVKANEPQGQYMNPFTVSIVIFVEAMASGSLFAYISMQYFKVNNQVKADAKEVYSN